VASVCVGFVTGFALCPAAECYNTRVCAYLRFTCVSQLHVEPVDEILKLARRDSQHVRVKPLQPRRFSSSLRV
jgi:hypothetical protein